MTWLFRLFTLISLAYLIYDRHYETEATIAATVSDPADPFFYPFSLTNNSHIFNVINLDWSCKIKSIEYENSINIANSVEITPAHKDSVPPGGTTNIYCAKNLIKVVGPKFISAAIQLQARYEVSIFGIVNLTKLTRPVTFTWEAGATEAKRQWVKGEP